MSCQEQKSRNGRHTKTKDHVNYDKRKLDSGKKYELYRNNVINDVKKGVNVGDKRLGDYGVTRDIFKDFRGINVDVLGRLNVNESTLTSEQWDALDQKVREKLKIREEDGVKNPIVLS